MSDKHPHVTPKQKEIVKRFGSLFNNTGGNDPLDLLNDFQKPSPNNLMRTNIVRFTLAMAVKAQVGLIATLQEEGRVS